MIFETALGREAQETLERIGHSDLLVGIPSYKNTDTINHVVDSALSGLTEYFPNMSAVLLNADGGSDDDTRAQVISRAQRTGVHVISTVYQGIPGKGSALRAIFDAASRLGVTACAVVDSDLRSITPHWIEELLQPIVQRRYDFIAPYYIRHKHDATITNNIAYPMTRMLYGVDVRQPIGGDFGFSGRLADFWAGHDVWQSDVARFGIDIWMTTTAIAGDFRVAQAALGAKVHDARDPAQSLGPMFRQVVGTLFSLMGRYADKWRAITPPAEPAPVLGSAPVTELDNVPVTVSLLRQRLQDGLASHGSMWKDILATPLYQEIEGIARQTEATFRFPPEVWVRTVFAFALAHRRGHIPLVELMEGMTPLYYGRAASVAVEAAEMTSSEAETLFQAQAAVFETLKPILVASW